MSGGIGTAGEVGAGRIGLVVGAVTAVQAFVTLAMLALATLAPVAVPDFGLSPEAVGYQVSLIYVAAALSSAMAGALTQRFGAGSMSLAALGLSTAGLAALTTGSLAVAAIGSLMIGAGYGVTNPAASLLLYRAAPAARRNLVFSIKQTGVPLGGALAGLALPGLASAFGWPGALLAAAALGLVVAGMVLPQRAAWDTGRQPVPVSLGAVIGTLGHVIRSPGLRPVAGIAFCYAAMQLCLMTFTVTFLVRDLGWPLVTAGAVLAGMQLAGAVGRVGWGGLADRIGKGAPILVAIGLISAAMAIAMAWLDASTPPVLVVLVLGVFAVTAIGWNGVFLAEVARLSGADAVSRNTGAVMSFTFTGVVIGPALFAILHGALGSYGATFALAAVVPVAGALFMALTRAQPRNPDARSG
ncbi:MAG: MFS transporter [Rhodobacteraceae bacterium]|nr:MAG: MFS transporter [Paracoccaceae bacterium]